MIKDAGKLELLDDLPAQAGKDKLHHEVYAGMLKEILISNKPGISIGLFGKWGSGKSTIVNLLQRLLPEQYETVVFNAWKARGDTVRRQLLLAVLKVICPEEKYKSIAKFAGIEVVQECVETAVRRYKKNKLAFFATCKSFFLDWSIALPSSLGVICIILAIVFTVKARHYAITCEDEINCNFFLTLATAFFLPAFAFLIVYVINKVKERYSFLIGNVEMISESQRLKYPEQFKRVFLENLRDYLGESGKGRLLVVVDDLDRCDPQTVVQALAALRQLSDSQELAEFLGNDDNGCQFLIPCDEEQVVLALETDGYGDNESKTGYHNYHAELLRKFFDVIVRMNDILPDDMSDYAAALCQEAGLEEKECREIVAIAGARDPREVKKLLNALRISHESIDQRCGKLLPDKKEMPLLAETERLLVALRETVPRAYRFICTNSADLNKPIPIADDENKSFVEEYKKANEMILRAGAVSRITADNLIYGKLDPELRDLPRGGHLQRAFINQEDAEFNKALSNVSPGDCDRVKNWLLKKSRTAKSDAELRGILRLFLMHAEKYEDDRKYMADCVGGVLLSKPSLCEVLAGFKSFDQLELVWPLLPLSVRHTAIDAFHVNFRENTAGADPELAFLLRHADQLEPAIKGSLQTLMLGEIKRGNNDDEFVKRLFDLIPSGELRKGCYGFAPKVAVTLAKKPQWKDDQDQEMKETPDKWPRSQLITLLIGDDSDAAWEVVTTLFGAQGQLTSPCPFKQAPPGVKPAWRTVTELTKIIKNDHISELFNYFQRWLNSQNSSPDAKIVLDALNHILLSLTDSDIKKTGDCLAQWLWREPTGIWLLDYVEKEPEDKLRAEKWASLAQSFFERLYQEMASLPVLNVPHSNMIAKIAEYKWPIAERADKLLGLKLRRLPPNGNTQQVGAWAKSLAPLLGVNRQQSAEAIRELLKNRTNIKEVLQVGSIVLWYEQVDADDAKSIGNICFDLGKQIDAYQDILKPLISIQGGGRIIEICSGLLKDDLNWLKDQISLLKFIARNLRAVGSQIQHRFQDKIKQLIISDDTAATIVGLTVLNECELIDSEVMKEIKIQEKSTNSQIQKLAKQVGAKMTIEESKGELDRG